MLDYVFPSHFARTNRLLHHHWRAHTHLWHPDLQPILQALHFASHAIVLSHLQSTIKLEVFNSFHLYTWNSDDSHFDFDLHIGGHATRFSERFDPTRRCFRTSERARMNVHTGAVYAPNLKIVFDPKAKEISILAPCWSRIFQRI